MWNNIYRITFNVISHNYFGVLYWPYLVAFYVIGTSLKRLFFDLFHLYSYCLACVNSSSLNGLF